MTKIDAIVYSYKNKNLKLVVDALLNNTFNYIFIYIFDQHPIDRSATFKDDRISYEHIPWDTIQSPCERKGNVINISKADYILQISDDSLVSPSWDNALITFISEERRIISGNRKIKLFQKDKFFLGVEKEKSFNFELSNYIDRNFVFASRRIWNSISYPYQLKYNGEEEMMSLDFYRAGKNIYSAPSNIYQDLGLRTLDNLYLPFSKNHGYNSVVDSLMSGSDESNKNFTRTRSDFFTFHKIENISLHKLPFSTDDVSYNPYGLSFQDIDARKFISSTKAIY
jgi:hypothetical protein